MGLKAAGDGNKIVTTYENHSVGVFPYLVMNYILTNSVTAKMSLFTIMMAFPRSFAIVMLYL